MQRKKTREERNEKEEISPKNKKIYVPEKTTTAAVKITGRTHNLNLIMERMS